jgi:hypothetical protein
MVVAFGRRWSEEAKRQKAKGKNQKAKIKTFSF